MGQGAASSGDSRRPSNEWELLFSIPKVNSCAQENKPFWVGLGPVPSTAAEILCTFFNDLCGDPDPYLCQSALIKGFCSEADLAVLADGSDRQRVGRRLAMLDDRTNTSRETTRGSYRSWPGPLTAHKLYHELRKMRFNERRNSRHRQTPNDGYTPVKTNEPDAERRLIYVQDVDCWAILAIIATASKNQVDYLRDFIYRHLAYQTSLGVHIPPIGFRTYALEVHIRFYVWKLSSRSSIDRRRGANGQSLRRCRDMDFHLMGVDSNHHGPRNYVYESLVSCLVTGFDERFWVSFVFDDTYYKGENNRESIDTLAEAVESSMEGDTRVLMDPSTRCEVNADNSIPTPRQYFLRVLECQVRRAKLEWYNVVQNLLRFTKSYEFSEHDRDRFFDFPFTSEPDSPDRLLSGIDGHMRELGNLCRDVQTRKQFVERREREISQYLQQESNIIASRQHHSTEWTRFLTIIPVVYTLLYLPGSLVMSMFSIDPTSLEFDRTPKTFGITITCVALFNILILLSALAFWHYWGRISRIFHSRERGHCEDDLEVGYNRTGVSPGKMKSR
ncbi:hypothetical protein BR93DRAFT_149680 [Coniochaeta sp. PMI_546]|nr:hypothetical protein BR93DRAFT_149680 [Coniochaeta sp. PMI_546]